MGTLDELPAEEEAERALEVAGAAGELDRIMGKAAGSGSFLTMGAARIRAETDISSSLG